MAAIGYRVTVTTAATRLDSNDNDPATPGASILARNRGAVSVFIGGPTVTAAAGFELEAGQAVEATFVPGDTLYGITASGTAVVHVAQVGV